MGLRGVGRRRTHGGRFDMAADSATSHAARRGNWKIGLGYRTWGTTETNGVPEDLSATELARGTMISAPDDWPAERIVATMVETRGVSGLDEVPH